MRQPARLALIAIEAHVNFTETRFLLSGSLAKLGHQFLVGFGGDKPVAELDSDLRAFWAGCGNHDRRRLLGQRVDAGVLEQKMFSVMAMLSALPQLPNDLDCFSQPFLTNLNFRPSVT